MNILLALNEKNELLKKPLTETYLTELTSTYSASFPVKHMLLGYDSQTEGFKKLPIDKLIVSERYISTELLVNFEIFRKDDFRDENQIFSFVAPRLVSKSPIGEITDILFELQYGFNRPFMYYVFNNTVEARTYGAGTGFTDQGKILNYRFPADKTYKQLVFSDYGSPQNMLDLYDTLGVNLEFVTGTEFYFSDSRGVFADSNHFLFP